MYPPGVTTASTTLSYTHTAHSLQRPLPHSMATMLDMIFHNALCDPLPCVSRLFTLSDCSVYARSQHKQTHRLPKPRGTSAHDFTLAHQLSIKLGPIQREVDVKVDAVKSALGGIHALKVLFEILPREIRRKRDDFLDT